MFSGLVEKIRNGSEGELGIFRVTHRCSPPLSPV